MRLSLKNAVISGFFGVLGPFFNKQATLDMTKPVGVFFQQQDAPWLIYPFDILCIVLMLVANTIAVKYKMLSYKYDGAFIGSTLIFALGYLFSIGFDYLYDQTILPLPKLLGAGLVIAGVICISWQEQQNHVTKRAPSVLIFIEDDGKEFFNRDREARKEPLLVDKNRGSK